MANLCLYIVNHLTFFVEHRMYLYSLRIKSLQHFKNIFLVFSCVTVLFVDAHNSSKMGEPFMMTLILILIIHLENSLTFLRTKFKSCKQIHLIILRGGCCICGLTMILISATNSPLLIYLVNHLLIMWQRKKSKENDVKFK